MTDSNSVNNYNPNIALTIGDIEIYQSEIDMLCDDYINTLPNPDMIYKSAVFSGMLNYIYNSKLRFLIDLDKKNNNINPKLNHYEFLDDIFNNIYINLCTRYNIIPTVLHFCTLVDIDNNIIGDIKSGSYRANDSKVNPKTRQIIVKWVNVCENMTLMRAGNESTIGSIFLSKAVYGYSDQAPQQLEIINATDRQTPEQIAERHRDAKPPQMIELDED